MENNLTEQQIKEFENILTELYQLILDVTKCEDTANTLIENIQSIIFYPVHNFKIEEKQAVIDITNSNTFLNLSVQSKAPLNNVRPILASSLFHFSKAIDNDLISFKNESNKALFLKLLTVVFALYFEKGQKTIKLDKVK